MKTKILLFFLATVVTFSAVLSADEEYDDYVEEDPAPPPPPKPVPARGVAAALQRSARGPLIGRASPKTQPPPKSTTEAPVENYDEDAPVEDEVLEEDVTTTTEAPKKNTLRGGILRPFRSNADLIEALKRRRQMHNGGSASHTTTTTTTSAPTEKNFKSNKRGSGSNKINNGAVNDQAGSDSQRKSTVNGRRFNPRGKTRETTEQPVQEAVAEETQQPRSRTFGRGRRF